MVNFLHRTSSFRVYEIIPKKQSQKVNKISKEMLKLGHKRTPTDIKGVVGIPNHFGLLEEKSIEKSTNKNKEPNTDISNLVNLDKCLCFKRFK